jgi:predicted metal-dependent hydrolase
VTTVVEAFDRAVLCFGARRYFEAHELFEFIWNRSTTDEKAFWKGLTQFAAGLCHLQRGNPSGARALLLRASALLERYPSPFRGVDARALSAEGRRLASEIESSGLAAVARLGTLPLV